MDTLVLLIGTPSGILKLYDGDYIGTVRGHIALAKACQFPNLEYVK